jgi:hypothetical protein
MERKRNGMGNKTSNRVMGVCPVEKAFFVDFKDTGGK